MSALIGRFRSGFRKSGAKVTDSGTALGGRGLVEPLWYNDWHQVDVPALGAFTPELPVSVIVPYYAQAEELARLLAALEGQTYPRELFEVVVVDDGSPEPLQQPLSTPLDVKLVRQEDLGFGLARARNTGVRSASHDVLLFLDADMLPEADWLAAHARWHHAVPDALTLGLRAHVAMDGVDAGTIRSWTGTLGEMLEGREVDWIEGRWIRFHLRRTDDLTLKADDLFRIVTGSNLGVRRGFHELVGGFDESFTQWGGEDTEFGYRAFVRGGLLVPAQDAFAWHQGLGREVQAEKERSQKLQYAKLAHLIAHPDFRGGLLGRTFTVPQYVVTIEAGDLSAEHLLRVVDRVLSGPMHDLVVRLELPADHPGREWLEHHLGPDPRVRVAPSRSALEEFPASPFHVTLPAGRQLPVDVVRRLRAELGTGVIGRSVFADGARALITRAWALHRALRTPWEALDFGDVVTIPAGNLLAVRGAPAPVRRAEYPLGVEIVALGARSRAVFAASRRVARTAAGQHLDVAVSDTAAEAAGVPVPVVAEAAGVPVPVVVLAESPPLLSVPAFDPLEHNPIGWQREVRNVVGALGPLDRLPRDCGADRVVDRDDRAALREIHHLEDVAAFHADAVTRAGELVRLAAAGVVVHLADEDRGGRQLAPYVGAELFELMTRGVRNLDLAGRELLSVRMRRAALREHSLTSRARQVAEHAALSDPPRLPLVSILLATRRPELLEQALEAVQRQTYPRLELVLGLHGEGFGEVAPDAAGPSAPVTVLRPEAAVPLGSVLNAVAQASRGPLLTKMDDDDLYGPDHIWDLVLAQEYSQAPLVGKGAEFVYLAASDRTIRSHRPVVERYEAESSVAESSVAGGTLLITRQMLDHIGGWTRCRRWVDQALIHDVVRAGVHVYRTHPYGFLLIRHGSRHTWEMDDVWFLAQATVKETGFRPDLAGLGGAQQPHS